MSNPDLFFWSLARVSGLASFGARSSSLLTGIARRTGVLDWLGTNRVLRSLHEYTALLWLPLGGLHLVALLLDQTARVRVIDLVVPFLMPYGALPFGLGTLAFDDSVRAQVIDGQRRRVADFDDARVIRELTALVQTLS